MNQALAQKNRDVHLNRPRGNTTTLYVFIATKQSFFYFIFRKAGHWATCMDWASWEE